MWMTITVVIEKTPDYGSSPYGFSLFFLAFLTILGLPMELTS